MTAAALRRRAYTLIGSGIRTTAALATALETSYSDAHALVRYLTVTGGVERDTDGFLTVCGPLHEQTYRRELDLWRAWRLPIDNGIAVE